MWNNYGRVFAEYLFIKEFRYGKLSKNIKVEGQEFLDQIKAENNQVIFVSAHFGNFELMAMCLDKSGINLSAIYRPLNNIFLNKIMERIRKKYICKNQIKKGRSNIRDLLRSFNNGSSIALMIDQRVSEGIKSKFFNKDAYTTTIPAQFVKKFNCKIVPINIERKQNSKFKLTVFNPITFNDNDSIEQITHSLNLWLEKIITNNPSKWIWSHDRWK
jgi:KDO2-lipid IV(A) lauroyltransferase